MVWLHGIDLDKHTYELEGGHEQGINEIFLSHQLFMKTGSSHFLKFGNGKRDFDIFNSSRI